MSSLAADTRAAVRRHPFLLTALRAGVVNYTAAARFLSDEIGHDEIDPVVTALRRFADDLSPYGADELDARVTMQRVAPTDDPAAALFTLGDRGFAADDGSKTAIMARGEAGPAGLASVLSHLLAQDIEMVGAGTTTETLVVVVERRAAANALRAVEDALSAVPS